VAVTCYRYFYRWPAQDLIPTKIAVRTERYKEPNAVFAQGHNKSGVKKLVPTVPTSIHLIFEGKHSIGAIKVPAKNPACRQQY
jgi:hypothetical protein